MNTDKIYDEAEIITLVSQWDEPAFAKLFAHHQNKIYTIALRLLIKELGLKREEAASVLDLKPETIKFHLAEAMKNIRSFCTPQPDGIIFITFYLFYSS